jgi:hypothetical protein
MLVAIDDEGNTLSHYLCSKSNFDFYLLNDFPLSDLKAAKNKAGKSALDAIIENDHEFRVAGQVKGLDAWGSASMSIASCVGASRQRGGQDHQQPRRLSDWQRFPLPMRQRLPPIWTGGG